MLTSVRNNTALLDSPEETRLVQNLNLKKQMGGYLEDMHLILIKRKDELSVRGKWMDRLSVVDVSRRRQIQYLVRHIGENRIF